MKKIISLFQRDWDGDRSRVLPVVTPGAEWVLEDPEARPTEKFDGTACLIKDGKLYRRHDVKRGKNKPDGFVPAQEPDEKTGHWPGWIPVGDEPSSKWHREAFDREYSDGTYELVGPKVQANPYGIAEHALWRHGSIVFPLSLTGMGIDEAFRVTGEMLRGAGVEGVVWHHPDGRMVKIKSGDRGIDWKRGEEEDE